MYVDYNTNTVTLTVMAYNNLNSMSTFLCNCNASNTVMATGRKSKPLFRVQKGMAIIVVRFKNEKGTTAFL